MRNWKNGLTVALLACMACMPISSHAYVVQDAEEQVALIASLRSVWDVPSEPVGTMGYMVTDLDSNGRLEIMVSQLVGTGNFTYTDVYEVTPDKQGLSLCEKEWNEEKSEADWLSQNEVPMYFDWLDGIEWYVVGDFQKDNYGETHWNLRGISLQDGILKEKPICQSDTYYDDRGNSHTVYYNAEGAVISSTGFEAQEKAVFAGKEKRIRSFPWLMYYGGQWEDWQSKSEEDIRFMLLDTYLNFAGEKEGMG